jgi:hypothetical protein
LNCALKLTRQERSFPQKRTTQIKQQLLKKTTSPVIMKPLTEAFLELPILYAKVKRIKPQHAAADLAVPIHHYSAPNCVWRHFGDTCPLE